MSFLINSAFTTDDIDVLRAAVNSWCAEKRIDLKSAEAQFAASAAIDLFQSGHTTSDRLMVAMRAHHALYRRAASSKLQAAAAAGEISTAF